MKGLRRWLIRLTLTVVVLAVLMSLVIGLLAERYFPDAVAQLDRQLGSWSLRAERFERGWWSSRVTVVAETPDGAPAWRYRERISHGPLLHAGHSLGWIGGQGTLELAAGGALAELQWRVTPTLTLTGRIDLAPAGPPDGSLEFSLDERFSRLHFQLRDLSYADAAGGFEGFDGSGWATLSGAPLDVRVALNGRRAHWPGAVVDAPELTVALDQDRELISLRLALVAAHAGLDQSYRDARAELVLARLHRPTLEQALSALTRVAGADLPAPMRNRQLRDNALLAVPGLLQHRPRVALERLDLLAPQGPVAASAAVGLSRPPPAGYLADPARALPALQASWEAALPEPLVHHWLRRHPGLVGQPPEQAAAVRDEFMQRLGALFQQDGERLISRGEFAAEVLTVNGKPVQPSALGRMLRGESEYQAGER